MAKQNQQNVVLTGDVLTRISAGNPPLDATTVLRGIQTSGLVLVGHVPTLSPTKGCIEWLFFDNNDTLTKLKLDGVWYTPTNLKDFQKRIIAAALEDKCINFCITDDRVMSMLNIYPQCCCPCDEFK